MYTHKAYLRDSRVTDISKSFTYKMAPKTSWHRYGTKLRHCHPVYMGHGHLQGLKLKVIAQGQGLATVTRTLRDYHRFGVRDCL